MQYQISRNGQMYGPYTFEDLQRYLASGNVLPTDLAKSDSMTDWQPVSAVMAAGGASASPFQPVGLSSAPYAGGAAANPYGGLGYGQPTYAQQAAALANSGYPDPPNLNWVLVAVLSLFTCGLFMIFWNIYVAVWLKKVQPDAVSLYFYIGALALGLLSTALSIPLMMHTFAAMHAAQAGGDPTLAAAPTLGISSAIINLIGIVGWFIRLVARFSQRASLQKHFTGPEPIGLDLNPVMTFFFGGLYFQYHLTRIVEMKKSGRMTAGVPSY
jgi:hypothetical protein